MLPTLAFDGASKRNKPNLLVGALVLARVVTANKDVEPELSCMALHGPKKEWVTGLSQFGELKDGATINASTALCQSLLQTDCVVLQCLGRRMPFEMAVGFNGFVWVRAQSQAHHVVITNAILNSEHLDDTQVRVMADELLRSVG